MDSPSRLAVAIEMATSLSETVDPLFRMVGGGTGFGVALMCAFEATRDEPRWDRATGFGAAGGAAIGSMFLLYDIIQSW